MNTTQRNLQILYTEARLDAVQTALDELHTAASEGNLHTVSTLSRAELVDWLREFIYTAQETLSEIESQPGEPAYLRLVIRKSS
jgi:hypothetical protein